ncbi:hypothetical protein AVEN_87623-1 [Araneus ventricosus]|uniref:MADF domain-containing protein n=1 Tax=Araneus ventricosus TaxID=182803 RepID=A0A4Y2RTR5_ARAVE|nr:hypothetical protein AVEN_87623-1 [Araneus ventricosus]
MQKKLLKSYATKAFVKKWRKDGLKTPLSLLQREDRKTKANSGSAGFDFVPKWVHYRQLLFLKDCAIVAPSESSLDTSIVEDESEATLTLCGESQLENLNGETSTSLQADTCQDEAANTFPIYGGPPRKKRKRTETEILAAATSALKSLGSRQGQQSSLYSSIGQVVMHTLESLNGEKRQKCMSDIFSLLAKYTAPTTGPSEA